MYIKVFIVVRYIGVFLILILNINWLAHTLPEIEWRKKAAEQGKPVEDDEFEDLTEDAMRLQEQELQKVTAARRYGWD